jgi:DNA polymerase I-like protein with 3'-5' exonuclease and polymerase domains
MTKRQVTPTLGLPKGRRIVTCDTETSGLYPDDGARVSAVSVAWRNDVGGIESRAFPFDQGALDKPGIGTPSLFEVDTNLGEREWHELMKWLFQQNVVMHHAKFDLQILHAGHRVYGGGVDLSAAVIWCTQVAQWVIDPEHSSSLKPTSARLWGEDERAEQDAIKPLLAKNGNRFDLLPWDVLWPYAAKDAELTLRLYEWQLNWLQERDGVEAAEIFEQLDLEFAVSRTLTRMAYRGIGYDSPRSLEEAAKARSMLAQLQNALPFKPTPMGARRYFFDTLKAMPHCVTKENKTPSVAECCVRSLIAQRVPHADEFAALQKVQHAIGTWYEGYAMATGADGRLRTDFKQAGTSTMRFASKRVNLQAIPQDFRLERLEGIVTPRSLFMAKEGYELWEFDLAQAEARVAAKVAKCVPWLEMFESAEPRDLHSETAIRLFGDAEYEHRQLAKRANFSLIYGVGPTTFKRDTEKQAGLILTEYEARSIVESWRKLYPEFGRAAKRWERTATTQGRVQLLDGRWRYFAPHEELHKAFNAVIQGSIAQFVKRWMVATDEYADVLLQIHDSIVVEVDKNSEDVIDTIVETGTWMATEFFEVPMYAESKQWKTLADEQTVMVA